MEKFIRNRKEEDERRRALRIEENETRKALGKKENQMLKTLERKIANAENEIERRLKWKENEIHTNVAAGAAGSAFAPGSPIVFTVVVRVGAAEAAGPAAENNCLIFIFIRFQCFFNP